MKPFIKVSHRFGQITVTVHSDFQKCLGTIRAKIYPAEAERLGNELLELAKRCRQADRSFVK